MIQLRIRDAIADDLPALRELFLAARRASFVWQPPESLTLGDFDEATRDEPILVATIDAAVVGFSSWWPPENFVHNLFVAPDRSRQGIGGALLDAAIARIGKPAWLKCDRRNARALAFYRARGWVVDEARTADDATWLPLVLR